MRLAIQRKVQLFWAYFIGLGALWGGAMFFIDPSGELFGMAPLLPLLKKGLPQFEPFFHTFIPSGIVLILVNAVPNGISIWLMHKHHRFSILSSQICALILLCWIFLEIYLWGFISLTAVYFFFAMLQLLNSFLWSYTRRVRK